MKKYRVVFSPTSLKQFKRLTSLVQKRLLQAIKKLSEQPLLGKLLKAELKDYRSYRVGDYRIIYYVRHQVLQVEIIRVAHRKEVYK